MERLAILYFFSFVLVLTNNDTLNLQSQDVESTKENYEQQNNEKENLFCHALFNISTIISDNVKSVSDVLSFLNGIYKDYCKDSKRNFKSITCDNYIFNGEMDLLTFKELMKLEKKNNTFVKIDNCYTVIDNKQVENFYINDSKKRIAEDKRLFLKLKLSILKHVNKNESDILLTSDVHNDIYQVDFLVKSIKEDKKSLLKDDKNVYFLVSKYNEIVSCDRAIKIVKDYGKFDSNGCNVDKIEQYNELIKEMRQYSDDEDFQTCVDVMDENIRECPSKIYNVLYCFLNRCINGNRTNEDLLIEKDKTLEKKGFKRNNEIVRRERGKISDYFSSSNNDNVNTTENGNNLDDANDNVDEDAIN